MAKDIFNENEKEALKFGIKTLFTLAAAGTFGYVMHGKSYQIGENRVRDGHTPWSQIVEYKGKDKIKYRTFFLDKDNYAGVKIKGMEYLDENHPVYIKGKERFDYLNAEVDYRKKAEKKARKDAKIKKGLEEEARETEEALNILRR